ncbi:uncharacterized protein LOC132747549 isoform X1 [Ruditapes philippinarum]|uniref:uncharacterized protein LOC132747549 isoform X1 n=1 Tax=Ruditapes philippinarum TaxID=129788 RepID=UPI00295ABBAF|nr:uncharacterized protein LOC132747549 isoform X1 [Ruditapes philippinarum]
MDRILITFLLTFTVLLKNAESTSLEANKFEELVVYITSLESKLNNVERKLSVVENQLEVQIDINQKQKKELQTQKAQIESLKTDKGQLKKKVEMIEKQHEHIDRFLKRILNLGVFETKTNITKRQLKRDVQQYIRENDDISTRFVSREGERVAFSAFLSKDLTNLGPGHTIQYGATYINEGNAFNAHTGIFTVPFDGVYLFFFSCEDYHNHRIFADILVDGHRKSLILEGGATLHSMGSNLVILRLTQGQSVWVAIDINGNNDSLQNSATTFSGVFLYY